MRVDGVHTVRTATVVSHVVFVCPRLTGDVGPANSDRHEFFQPNDVHHIVWPWRVGIHDNV